MGTPAFWRNDIALWGNSTGHISITRIIQGSVSRRRTAMLGTSTFGSGRADRFCPLRLRWWSFEGNFPCTGSRGACFLQSFCCPSSLTVFGPKEMIHCLPGARVLTSKPLSSSSPRLRKRGGADFIPPAERIAVFDNDGTLWAEQPLYFQVLFALGRVKALAPEHPE